MIRITILYDNRPNPEHPDLETSHGFSAYVEVGSKKILFDTGWDGPLLLRNCARLNIDLHTIDAIFISHNHWDHRGGLPSVIPIVDQPVIYLPDGTSTTLIKEFSRYINQPTVYRMKDFQPLTDLSPNLASTGTITKRRTIGEHSLLIRDGSPAQTVLLVGCLHPGLKPLLNAGRSFDPITQLIGGLHGFKDTKYLATTDLNHIYPGHCTKHLSILKNFPQKNPHVLYVGRVLEFF